MKMALAVPDTTLTFEVHTTDDLFRAFAFLGLALSEANKKYEQSSLGYTDLLAVNMGAAPVLQNLWQLAERNKWDGVFTTNVISADTLTPERIRNSVNFGNSLFTPIARMAGNMIQNYPGLTWDTTAQSMQDFVDMATFYVGGTAEQSECLLEILLGRMEFADQITDSKQRAAYDQSNWSLAQILIDSNLKGEDRRARVDENCSRILGEPRKFVLADESQMIQSNREREEYERLSRGEPAPAMVALLSARVDFKNAGWKYVGDSIGHYQQRAKAAEERALALLSPPGLDIVAQLAAQILARRPR